MRKIYRLPNFSFEKKLWRRGFAFVAGVDEVGRGAFAGPIVAAAIIFPSPNTSQNRAIAQNCEAIFSLGIDDSKRLKPRRREELASQIKKYALAWSVAEVGVRFINKYGIGKATAKAMRKAVENLFEGQAEVAHRNFDSASNSLAKNRLLLNDSHWRSQGEASQNLWASRLPFIGKVFLLVDGFHVKYLSGGVKNQKAIIHGDQKSISIAAASILAKVYRDKIMRRLGRQPRYKVYGWGRNKGYGTKLQQKAILRYGLTRFHRKQFVKTWLARKAVIKS